MDNFEGFHCNISSCISLFITEEWLCKFARHEIKTNLTINLFIFLCLMVHPMKFGGPNMLRGGIFQ